MSKRRKVPPKGNKPSRNLPEIRPDVAGIDLGSTEHFVCAPTSGGAREVRSCGTTPPKLREWVDWLKGYGVRSVAMESPSVYWIPLYELLEFEGIDPVLSNAMCADRIMHGKTSPVHRREEGIFQGLPDPFEATRYHSLIVKAADEEVFPITVTAETAGHEIMGIQHRHLPIFGVQFHPESILTSSGKALLGYF